MKSLWIFIVIILIVLVGAGIYFTITNIESTNIKDNKEKLISTPLSELPEEETEKTPTTESTESKTYNVNIEDFAFSSKELKIKQGDKIVWTNLDSAKHTVTSDAGNELDSELLGEGKSYSHTFNNKGTFSYHCKPHPYMKGKIIVE